MDGTNIADISDKAPSSLSGVLLGVDTVQEFSVQTHGYSAEFGRAAGGVMSAVTKSGTNQIRGTRVRVPPRRSARFASNFFDDGRSPRFPARSVRRHRRRPDPVTTGCSTSARYEGLRERNAVTRFARLPNALAHQGIVPNAQGSSSTSACIRPRGPISTCSSRFPTGQDFGDGTAELAHAHQDPTDEHFGVVKFDYNIGKGGSTFMVRWSRDVSDTTHLAGAPAVLRAGRHRHALLHDAVSAALQLAAAEHGAVRRQPDRPRQRPDADRRHPDARCTSARTRTGEPSTSRTSRPPDRSPRFRSTTSRTSTSSPTRSRGRRAATSSRPASTGRTTTSTGSRTRATAASSASARCRSS